MAVVDAMEEAAVRTRLNDPGMGAAWAPYRKEIRVARAALHEAKKHNRASAPELELRLKRAYKKAQDAKDAFLRSMHQDVKDIKADVGEIKKDVNDIKTIMERLEMKVDHDIDLICQRQQFQEDQIEKMMQDDANAHQNPHNSNAEAMLRLRMASQRNNAAMNEVRLRAIADAKEAKRLAALKREVEKAERAKKAEEAKAAREAKAAEKATKAAEAAKRKEEAQAAPVAKKRRIAAFGQPTERA